MPSIYSNNYFPGTLHAEATPGDGLLLKHGSYGDTVVHVAGLPAGVAEATADAFNAAMAKAAALMDAEDAA